MSNLICSLKEKKSTNNYALWRGQNLLQLRIAETKFMDYFTKIETFSEQWPFVYSGNKLYSHKKRKIITDY